MLDQCCVHALVLLQKRFKDYVYMLVSRRFFNYCIYSNTRLGFFSLNMVLKYDIILNPCMKCQTALYQTQLLSTRPCGAKPLPALPYCHVRYAFFQDITQHRVVIPYWRFGTNYRSHLQGSSNPKEQSMTKVNCHSLPFWHFAHCLIF